MNLMQYIIVTGNSPYALTVKVMDYLEKGWRPQGGVVVDKALHYIQALVKDF